MIDPKLAIPKISRLLSGVASEDETTSQAAFAAIRAMIAELHQLAKTNELSA